MPSRNVRVNIDSGRALLDVGRYARRAAGRRDSLSPAELQLVTLTVHRAPEVMVKVLTKGSTDLASVSAHFGYVGRYGELEIETDDGELIKGRHIGRDLIEDWDLDLYESRPTRHLSATFGRKPPKPVHKLILSMPSGTPPLGLLSATRNFLREEFALKHRYAFVLHTDEPHPHVHVVVKAVSEQGVRLNIKKNTLRQWRQEFARHLREQGIEANATDRAVRGQGRITKLDSIYRAAERGESSHVEARMDAVARELSKGRVSAESGKAKLVETRKEVVDGWHTIADILRGDGRHELAEQVQLFVEQMPPARTDKEQLAAELAERAQQAREGTTVQSRDPITR